MKQHFQKKFAYNTWANNLFIDCFNKHTVANAKCYLLMGHLLTAEEIWRCRLSGKPAPQDQLWKDFPLAELQEKAGKSSKAWELYIEEADEHRLQQSVSYKNSKGEFFTTTVTDILTHLINHGTYHRAQVASLLRLEGIDPPVSDYIAFVRQQDEAEAAYIVEGP